MIVAIPAGFLIWVLANVSFGDITLLSYCTDFLDPFGRMIGMDGVILMGFLLGFPANEIVIPIIIMSYLSTGSLVDMDNLVMLRSIFIENGWTWLTAICVILFSLIHFPCSTTCLTIYKETKSVKWTIISILLPTVCGILLCFGFSTIVRLFGFV